MKIVFLGTSDFVQPIKTELAKNFELVDSLDKADLCVVASYGHILTKQELNTPKFGCINIHPSLLPKYRGASPIQSAILNGDKITGVTIIKMDDRVDHGPIIYQDTLELSDIDNFDTLSKKMFLHAANVLPKIIEDFITGKIVPKEQDHNKATFCERLTKESGYFPIDNPPSPDQQNKIIRAYFPWPSCWTLWNNKVVKFLPGDLIQMEGKKAISKKDFLNGYPEFPLK